MKSSKQINIQYTEFSSEKELDEKDLALVLQARKAMATAYAPYSRYGVGCAVELDNGETVIGNNQENMAYPSGLCAERVALFTARAKYPETKILAMAIVASSSDAPSNSPSASCGACRQVMIEYEMNQSLPIRVIFQGMTGPVIVVDRVTDLLPLHFHEDGLGRS